LDKKSEQRKDAKACGDTDVGVTDYGAGGKREQLAGLWNIPSKEVIGLGPERLMTNDYRKVIPGEKEDKPSLLDQIVEHGPPLLNVSKPRRIF
jgi:hypothetical protein